MFWPFNNIMHEKVKLRVITEKLKLKIGVIIDTKKIDNNVTHYGYH